MLRLCTGCEGRSNNSTASTSPALALREAVLLAVLLPSQTSSFPLKGEGGRALHPRGHEEGVEGVGLKASPLRDGPRHDCTCCCRKLQAHHPCFQIKLISSHEREEGRRGLLGRACVQVLPCGGGSSENEF